MHSILVRDYMQSDPVAFDRNTNLLQAVHKLLAAKMTGAPVIDESRTVIGFVSEQDCIKEILQGAFYCEDPPAVASVMSSQVLSFKPDHSVVEVAQQMITQKPKIYPVISEGKLVGVISRSDVLAALLDNDEDCYLRAK
ncbi:CBS domain-containing protein [Gilvimarinus sp. SDUM040013]|uniref:CBS domain-containing protein n=1 Tax=Gilvimarinus gilvus TaxID=3058038 RepID=A0ABU4RXT0_9GAMM|nr:CBS domain-containing protein [Gilvimarinus sp. SDUM040013]MDO3386425.1 CBS domain-containing protein [Gilvimarinus sp. SDUM040013]MDX6849691.1 CBS domain-containing protein [Gilvimarinus sp. SDUM040013]